MKLEIPPEFCHGQKRHEVPHCGATMNHHADKLIYESVANEPGVLFSGSIEEFYRCPNCGAGASRPEILGDRA